MVTYDMAADWEIYCWIPKHLEIFCWIYKIPRLWVYPAQWFAILQISSKLELRQTLKSFTNFTSLTPQNGSRLEDDILVQIL
jgi:hypothetical protein